MTDDARLIEMPTPAQLPSATSSRTRGETSEMLPPSAVFLLIMLIACTLTLLICWACDAHRAEIEAGRSRPAVLEFSVHPLREKICGSRYRVNPHAGRPAEIDRRSTRGRSMARREVAIPTAPEKRTIRLEDGNA